MRLESSMPLRVSLVNLQKFTLQACVDVAEHVDVGAGAEHALLAAGEHDAADLGMLEADAVQRVVQLDIDAEIVGIELELVAGHEAAILGDVERQRRHRPVDRRCANGGSASGSVSKSDHRPSIARQATRRRHHGSRRAKMARPSRPSVAVAAAAPEALARRPI